MTDHNDLPDDRNLGPDAGHQPAGAGASTLSGSELAITTRRDDGAVVLHVAGEIDMLTAPRLAESITQVLEQRPPILVVDLSDVIFLASAGLEALIAAHRAAGEHTQVRIVTDDQRTLRPIELTGLTEHLAVYSSLDEALNAD